MKRKNITQKTKATRNKSGNMSKKAHVIDLIGRTHRQKNYWEVTFNPKKDPIRNVFNWDDLKNSSGPVELICDICLIKEDMKITEKIFNTCDFINNISFNNTFTFRKCEFKQCHFGWTKWENVKFQDCTFTECAFAITTFERCQFQKCEFAKLTVSANETIFKNCIINPRNFIDALITNLPDTEILNHHHTSKEYQNYRFFKSKFKIAKNILLSLKETAEEELYIDAVEIEAVTYFKFRIREALYSIKTERLFKKIKFSLYLIPRLIEYSVIYLSGKLNRWGFSIGRISIIGIVLWSIFGFVYSIRGSNLENSFIKAFEILTLAGYSKYDIGDYGFLDKVLCFSNFVFGLCWFSIFVPTIISRIRSRE